MLKGSVPAKGRVVIGSELIALVQDYVEGRQFGLLGQPRVNVLLLNRALDAMHE